jgi:phosphatidylglycerol:prolipoprotein diacylglycerol transferase
LKPILFELFGFAVPTYGVLYLTAYLASISTFAWLASRCGDHGFSRLLDIGFIVAISGEAGARLTFLIVSWDRLVAGQIDWGRFLTSGRVVLGGVVLGFTALVILLRKYRLPVGMFSDAALAGVTLGMGIGRLGCLMAGCCYGRETDAWWGITFSDPAARLVGTTLDTPLHPTQPLQALAAFLLFGFLLWLFFNRSFDGQVAGWFWIITGLSRFTIEFLRGDERGAAGGISTSQWIGLFGVAAGVAWLLFFARRKVLTPVRPRA